MHKKLPWEDIEGSKFESIDAANLNKNLKYGIIISIFFLILGITQKNLLNIFFGALILLAANSKKYTVVSKRGLEIFYDMVFTTNYEKWDFENIYAITYEEFPNDSIKIYFTKGDRTKNFLFKKSHLKEILEYSKKKNPQIKHFNARDYK